jgi:hypothetical protein
MKSNGIRNEIKAEANPKAYGLSPPPVKIAIRLTDFGLSFVLSFN